MLTYLMRRILILIPMAVGVSVLMFFGIRTSPVDPINYLVPPEVAAANQANLAALRHELGLDAPIIIQYFHWLGDMFTGNLGYSITTGQKISTILALRIPATLELVLTSLVLSTVLALGIGLIAGAHRGGLTDKVSRVLAIIGIAVPEFFVGIIVLQIFGYKLGWFPTGGRYSPGETSFGSSIEHVVLPVVALTFGLLAVLIRYTRNSVLDTLNREFVKTARSKGIPEWKVLWSHVFRNSLAPVMVILVFRIPLLVGGSVLIESVFRWPGIGSTIIEAVQASDYPVIMVTSMIIAIAILVASFLIDITKAMLDPRVRLG